MSRILDALASTDPGRVLSAGGPGDRLTHGEFLGRVEDVAKRLPAHPGSVGLALDNSTDWLAADLALASSSHVCVPVPPWFTPAQLGHVISAAGLSSWIGVTPPPAAHGRPLDLGSGLALWPLRSPSAATLPTGTSKITFTSGTTGQPKGVCLSSSMLERVAASLADVGRDAGVRRHLCILPLSVLLENVAGAWAAMLAGAEVVAPPMASLGLSGATGADPARLAEAVVAHEAESLILVPQLLEALVAALEAGAPRPRALRFVAVGGARVPPGLLARARALGVPVREGYGLSECGSVVSLDREADGTGGVGHPLPHAPVTLGPDGEILAHGELMLGYVGDPRPVPRPWPTGDLGSFDARGRLHVVGRKRNVFITAMGRNVSPEWVEAELTGEGPIRQAAVFGEGLPRPVAVLFAPGADRPTIEAAVARANRRLPDYAQIHGWQATCEPFTSTNAMATTNGRLRRDRIAVRFLPGMPVATEAASLLPAASAP